jgi:hypothetical protein
MRDQYLTQTGEDFTYSEDNCPNYYTDFYIVLY